MDLGVCITPGCMGYVYMDMDIDTDGGVPTGFDVVVRSSRMNVKEIHVRIRRLSYYIPYPNKPP